MFPEIHVTTGRERLIAAVVSLVAIAAILWADWVTGPDVNLDLLFAGPSLLMARVWGTRTGLLTALACSTLSLGGDVLLNLSHATTVSTMFWNGAVRAVMLGTVTVLYGRLQARNVVSHEQASLFKSVVETSAEAIAISSPEGRLIFANPAYERLFGSPLSNVRGRLIRDFLAADPPSGSNSRFVLAREHQEPWSGAVLAQDTSGRPFSLWVRGDYVRDSAGAVRYGFGFMHDFSDEKRSLDELLESRRLLEHAMDQAMLAYWELDVASRTFTFNDRFYRLFATTAEREGGYRMAAEAYASEFVQDGTLSALRSDIERLLTGRISELRTEHVVRRRDGESRHMRAVLNAVRDENGTIVRTQGSIQDVTEVRRVEEALRASLERLQASDERFVSMAANSPALLYRFSNRRGGLYYSPRSADMLGLPPEALLRDPMVWRSIIHPDDLARVNAVSAALRSSACQQSVEYRIRLPDGRERWLRVRATSHAQPDGELITDGLVLDITDLHAAEEALRASEELYRTTLETLPVGVLLQGPASEIRIGNEKSYELLGLTREQLTGKSSLDAGWNVVHEDMSPFQGSTHPVPTAIATRRAVRDVVMGVYRPNSGDRVWLTVNANPVLNPDASIREVICTFADITDVKRAADRLRASLREKETLLREVHHRVKNNMQVISSMLDLQREHATDAGLKAAFLLAEERVRAMAMLHEKLYLAADVANIDFADYLRSLSSEVMAAYGADAARIGLRVSGHEIRLTLDAAVPCALVVNELLTNALKHAFPAGRRGEIGIDLMRESGRIVLTVRDNGVGLPAGFDLTKVKSLGLQLVDVLARQLRGSFRLTNSCGVAAELSFPLNEEATT
jgi:PAS domain S-box-containing protein